MTATNHALTGALIGFSVSDPFIAIPLAFISHFVLDIVPHFGSNTKNDDWVKSINFKILLAVDIIFCIILGLAILILRPRNYLLAFICAIIATSPDLVHLKRFINVNKDKTHKPNWFEVFSGRIQWFEKPSGALVEFVYGMSMILLIRNFF